MTGDPTWFPHAIATLRVHDHPDRQLALRPGMIVGRGDVHVVVADPEVSEAHAMVSLRADGLVLLRLRGRVLLRGDEVDDAPLRSGDVFTLTEGVRLSIATVHTPPHVLGLRDPAGRSVRVPLRYACFTLDPLAESPVGSLETWVEGTRVGARLDGATTVLTPGTRVGPLEVVLAEVARTAPTLRPGPVLDCTGEVPVLRRSRSGRRRPLSTT